MKTVSFVNPLTSQPVEIYAHLVFAVTYLPQNKVTAVTSIGGAAVPVDCTLEEAKAKINAALAENQGEKNSGI